MASDRITQLKELYDEYLIDPRFDHLRQEGINFVGGSGPINPRLMLIGEAPGRMENARRTPFVGKAGIELNKLLEFVEVDVYEIFLTNVMKYWPQINFKTKSPTEDEIRASREYLMKEIDIVDPDIVGLCGGSAIRCIYPEIKQVRARHGKLLDNMFVPLYHPATILYEEGMESMVQMGYLLMKSYLDNKEERAANHG